MKKPVAITAVIAAAVAGAGVGAFTQRDLIEEVLTHEKSYSFDDIATLKAFRAETTTPPYTTRQRAWMADDATDIRMRFVTTEKPGWDISFDTATGLSPELLAAGKCAPAANPPKPALDVDWLPSDLTGAVSYCADDQTYVKQKGGTVFGWQAANAKLYPNSR